jgi:hypothetical protein
MKTEDFARWLGTAFHAWVGTRTPLRDPIEKVVAEFLGTDHVAQALPAAVRLRIARAHCHTKGGQVRVDMRGIASAIRVQLGAIGYRQNARTIDADSANVVPVRLPDDSTARNPV